MNKEDVALIEEKRSKALTYIITAIATLVFLFCGIGFLTDIGQIPDPETPMTRFQPDESDDEPSPYIPFFEDGVPQNPLMTVTPAPAIQKSETFNISFSDPLPDIFNALPSQTFDTEVSVTNESRSVDSAYVKVAVDVPTIEIDGRQEMVFIYNSTKSWDISYRQYSDYMRVEAIYRDSVRAGEKITLFDSVTINPKLNRDHYLGLYNHRLVGKGETPTFNIQFDATGVQVTGFDSYRAAFQ